MSKIIGIDLGTTNSCVAVMEAASPLLSQTLRVHAPPVCCRLHQDRRPSGGSGRKAPGHHQPENTVASIKRYMGTDTR